MAVVRDGTGRLHRTWRKVRNVRRLHLQCQVTKGGALSPAKEKAVRQELAKLLEKEGLTGRRYDRLINKRTRRIA